MASDAWIVSSGRVLASAKVVTGRRERRRGLLGRDDFDGALVLPHCRWIHTIGMKFSIDAAYLDETQRVIKVDGVGRNRFCAPVRQAVTVIEARRGAFERWGLHQGDILEVRSATEPSHR
ncbi:MAG: DUF192 domain-containing protein [Ilumatobacteraceae bacterium]